MPVKYKVPFNFFCFIEHNTVIINITAFIIFVFVSHAPVLREVFKCIWKYLKYFYKSICICRKMKVFAFAFTFEALRKKYLHLHLKFLKVFAFAFKYFLKVFDPMSGREVFKIGSLPMNSDLKLSFRVCCTDFIAGLPPGVCPCVTWTHRFH